MVRLMGTGKDFLGPVNIGNPNEAAESQHLVSWRKPVSNFIANTWKNTILSTKNRVLHSYTKWNS